MDKKNRMTFSQFRLRLTEQMLRYDPCDVLYAGDNKFRRSTQLHKHRRRTSKDLSGEVVKEALAPAEDIVEEALAPVVATGKGHKRKGRKLPFSEALHPSVIIEDGSHA